MRFVLLYDCPMKNNCKMWLYEGLKKYDDVKIIPALTRKKTYFEISRFMPRLKIGRIVILLLTFVRAIICIIVSNKNDVIVVWANKQGCMLENICSRLRLKRKIVSFMWISMPKYAKKAASRSFKNPNFMPIINNLVLEKEFINSFDLKKWNGLFLPDVFNDRRSFNMPEYGKVDKYVFAGGSNNRDWETLIKVTKDTPDIKYIVVCDKGKIGTHPNNMIVKENLPADEYYALMEKAFVTICPLKENRTSGLVNILRSAQFGIPCISTKLDVTAMYYSASMRALLYHRNDYEDLKKKIIYLYNLGEKEYIEIAKNFQNYIKKNFSPEENMKKLIEELKKRKWI